MIKMNTIVVNNEKIYLLYQKNFLDKNDLNNLKKWLDSKSFRSGTLLNGKEIGRRQLWYQKDNKYFCNKWKHKYDRWESETYDTYLSELEYKINEYVDNICKKNNLKKLNINSCLINKYRDGNDSIKPHIDNKDSFGNYPIIVGLSIGETRDLIFKKILNNESKSLKIDDSYDPIKYSLEDNSLFIMAGASQKYFTHEVPKDNSVNTRYSLTFREYLDHE